MKLTKNNFEFEYINVCKNIKKLIIQVYNYNFLKSNTLYTDLLILSISVTNLLVHILFRIYFSPSFQLLQDSPLQMLMFRDMFSSFCLNKDKRIHHLFHKSK